MFSGLAANSCRRPTNYTLNFFVFTLSSFCSLFASWVGAEQWIVCCISNWAVMGGPNRVKTDKVYPLLTISLIISSFQSFGGVVCNRVPSFQESGTKWSIFFKLNSVYAVELQCSTLCVVVCMVGQLFFVVECLATQTGGATVWSNFSLIFGYHIGGGSTVNRVVKSVIRKFLKLATPLVPSSGEIINGGVGVSEDRLEPNLIA